MKLAKYLADYIEYETEKYPRESGLPSMNEIIQQGIEAFESTEAVKVLVVSEELAYRMEQQVKEAEELE